MIPALLNWAKNLMQGGNNQPQMGQQMGQPMPQPTGQPVGQEPPNPYMAQRNMGNPMRYFLGSMAANYNPGHYDTPSTAWANAAVAANKSTDEFRDKVRKMQESDYKRDYDERDFHYKKERDDKKDKSDGREYDEMTAYQKAMIGAKEKELSGKSKDSYATTIGELPEEAILYKNMGDKMVARARVKEIDERASRLNPGLKNLKNMDKIDEIVKQHPNLYNSVTRIFNATLDEDPTVLKNMFAGLNKDELTAAQKISKFTNDILVNQIKAFPGRTTDVTKLALKATLGGTGTTPEAFAAIKEAMDEDNLRIVNDARAAWGGKKGHYYIPENIEEQSSYIDEYNDKYNKRMHNSDEEAPENNMDADRSYIETKRKSLGPAGANITDQQILKFRNMQGGQ